MEDWAMKKIIWFALVIVFALSCKQEVPETIEGEVGGSKPVVTFKALLPDTKTELSAKDGDVWHNYWSIGDAISVNGIASGALAAEDGFVGTGIAEFNVEGSLSAPYNFGYPASAITGYSDGSATVTIPASQSYVAGKYDSSAYIMLGSSSDADALEFVPMMALLQITPTAPTEGSLTVKGIRVEAIGGEKMSGSFTTDFGAISGGEYSFVELNPDSPISFGTPVLIAIPAQNYASGVRIVITASDDTSMTFSKQSAFDVEASKLYPIAAPAFVPSSVSITAWWAMSSSSVAIRWSGSNPANDFKKEWRIHVYTDEACSDEHSCYTIPANADCWTTGQKDGTDSTKPTFIIGGLTQGTPYWFKVEDVANGVFSNSQRQGTTAFTPVKMPSAITSSSVSPGDNIFAEDFSEIKWGQTTWHTAGGFIPADKSSFANYSTEEAAFLNGSLGSGNQISFRNSDFDAAISGSRLDGWLSESSVFIHPGFLQLGTGSSAGFVITPEFPIEAGKVATVKVTVNATRYKNDCHTNWTVAVIKNPVDMKSGGTSRESDFAWMDINDTSLYQEVTINTTNSWTDAEAVGLELEAGDRIVFGRAKNNSNSEGKARVYLNSLKVELIELVSGTPDISVTCLERTSSTLSFEWKESETANNDNAKEYTASLYTNSACSGEPVQHYIFPANSASSIWRSDKYPKFIFSGLSANTHYYLKIVDGDNKSSKVIIAKTEPFTVVEMPDMITSDSKGVVLAEDFSLFRWGFEYGQGCVGLSSPESPSAFTEIGSSYVQYSETVGSDQVFTSSAFASSRLNKWSRDAGTDARVMVHPGYITLGSATNNEKAWLLTPPFNLDDGLEATVDIEITVRKGLTGATGDYAIGVLNDSSNNGANGGGANMKDQNTSDFSWPDERPATVYNTFTVSNDTEWATKVFSGMTIKKNDRVVIGSRAGYSYSSKKSCLNVSDIKVSVTSIQYVGSPLYVGIGE